MNKYKYHHKILTFFKEEFNKYDSEDPTKYCFSSKQIADKFKINILKSERILFDLKDLDCLYYSKYNGFKISENGIIKHSTKYFIYKKNENLKTNFKDLIQILFPLITISFSIYTIFSKIEKADNDNKKEIQELKKRIENIESTIQKRQTSQKNN